MTQHDHLQDLKRIAKKIARSERIPLHEAQNMVAEKIDFPHWYALATAAKADWHANADHVASAETILEAWERQYPDDGLIGERPYRLDVVLGDVYMSGRGWRISIGEAPSSKPRLQVTDKRFKRNPINDPEFVAAALRIANWKAGQVRAEIARDWPRRSTKADAEGRAAHPIGNELSDTWYCFHCDEKISGTAIALNMWHCPKCGASPIDISTEPFPTGDDPGRPITAV